MADIDAGMWIEYDYPGGAIEPVMLIETKVDIGQESVSAEFLRALARRANVPAYIVLYTQSETFNPTAHYQNTPDIEMFRVRELYREHSFTWSYYSPREYIQLLTDTRNKEIQRLSPLPVKVK